MALAINDFGETDRPASVLLRELAHSLTQERVTVGELIDRLDSRAQGLLLLMLSLPMCIPNIPGISTLFGLLLIPPAIQLLTGRSTLWMPRRVRAWGFDGSRLRAALRGSAKLLSKVEHLSRPRARPLTHWPATSVAGFQTLIMALVLILPIWGANLIPGVAVALTGLGLLQRDGWAIIASTPVAIGAVAWVYFGTKYTINFFVWLANWGHDMGVSLF